jgi:uncharacterized membrane protein
MPASISFAASAISEGRISLYYEFTYIYLFCVFSLISLMEIPAIAFKSEVRKQ